MDRWLSEDKENPKHPLRPAQLLAWAWAFRLEDPLPTHTTLTETVELGVLVP